MKKIIICLIFISIISLPVLSGAGSALNSVSVFPKKTRPAVKFDHDTHNEESGLDNCAICHHIYENGKLIEDESSEDQLCSDCHSLKAAEDNSVPLTKAFHLRCKKCHEKEGSGPVLCGECHIKHK